MSILLDTDNTVSEIRCGLRHVCGRCASQIRRLASTVHLHKVHFRCSRHANPPAKSRFARVWAAYFRTRTRFPAETPHPRLIFPPRTLLCRRDGISATRFSLLPREILSRDDQQVRSLTCKARYYFAIAKASGTHVGHTVCRAIDITASYSQKESWFDSRVILARPIFY